MTPAELSSIHAAAGKPRHDLLDLGARAPLLCSSSRLIIHSYNSTRRLALWVDAFALTHTVVQQAVATILNQIYEEDFRGFSYGFRPGRSQHQALDALYVAITRKKVNWVLDCDIRGFFDNLSHEWLLKFVQHRIADRRIFRLIQKWLKAGVMVEGEWKNTEMGTPQGSVISPLLANIYLHYVFDLWVDVWRKKSAQGDVVVVRYADGTPVQTST